MAELIALRQGPLPVGPVGRRGLGWWGVGTLVATEAALFGYLLFSYFYTGATAPPGWLLEPRRCQADATEVARPAAAPVTAEAAPEDDPAGAAGAEAGERVAALWSGR